ncbi:MAG: 30S ribosomal protein S8 [Candidatus Pacebacteria bacterium]|nr:30S ribosomal protein S8 [Candidatus Paceibacterota bacterium]MBP9840176.1 30S ribosomal protein S8 [Candidatus Paceibacterota bacterium]
MITDRVGDFIIRLKNASASGKAMVNVPHSAHLESIAKKLMELGYVASVETTRKEVGKTLDVALRYDDGTPRIRGVKRISKPGRRLYTPAREAHTVKNGIGARLISTPKGVLSDKEARKVRVGGEDLFEIW